MDGCTPVTPVTSTRTATSLVVDRVKDVLEAADGTVFSPTFIENKLKFSPYVEEAVVFGGGDRPHVAAMVAIDMETVGTWAERKKLSYTTYTDLAQKSEVYELVGRGRQAARTKTFPTASAFAGSFCCTSSSTPTTRS